MKNQRFNVLMHAALCLGLVWLAAGLPQTAVAQSGFGLGIVYSAPHSGGMSLQYRGVRVLSSGRIGTDSFYNVAVRYNYAVAEWTRARLHVYGQAGRRANSTSEDDAETSIDYRYRFSAGSSMNLWRNKESKSPNWVLSVDLGISVDQAGEFGRVPAFGIGIHRFF